MKTLKNSRRRKKVSDSLNNGCSYNKQINIDRIKSFGLTNKNLKSFDQIGGSMCGKESRKELQPSVSHQA